MRKKIMEIGTVAQQHAHGAEMAIDMGLIESSGLLASLLKARMDLGFAAGLERNLLAEVGKLVTSGLEARERALTIHEQLSGIAARFNINVRAFGDGGDKDWPASAELTLVSGGAEKQAA